MGAQTTHRGILASITKVKNDDALSGDLRYAFYNCANLKEIQLINTSAVTGLYMTFYKCPKLETLGEMDCGNVTSISYAFNECWELTNMGGLKNIGKSFTSADTINLQACEKLTHESALNLLNGLYDLRGNGITSITPTIAFATAVFSTLTSTEKAIGTNKGWIIK